jgi:hypothetical protein
MSVNFSLADRLRGRTKVVERSEEIKVEVTDEVDVVIDTIDSDVTAFCKRASRFVTSKESLRDVLDFIRFINEYKLAKQCNIASKDLDNYWLLIEEYANLSDQQVRTDVDNYVSYRDENTISAIKNVLWSEGAGNLSIGLDIRSPVDHTSPIIKNALDNKNKLVMDIVSKKYSEIAPVIDQIIKCVPTEDTRHLVTVDARREFVFGLVDQFIAGQEFNVRFDIKKMGSVTQAGLALPHTLSPRDWLATAVSMFIRAEFGAKTMIMFAEKGVSDVRKYDHARDAFLLFSDEEDNALHYSVSPAIHCDKYEKSPDGIDVWAWRNLQKTITANVNSECLRTGDVSPANRERNRKLISYQFARTFISSEMGNLEWDSAFPFLAVFPQSWIDKTQAEVAIRFFKRGYSTPQELAENSQYLHIISLNNARTMIDAGYVMIQLSDMNSVIAIPNEFWSISNFVQHGRSGGYISNYGVQKVSSVDDPYLAFFTFFSLACTKQMLDKWQVGEVFDYERYSTDFINILKRKGAYATLLKTNSRNLQDKLNIVAVLMQPFPGPVFGLVLAPESTKHGKSSLSSYTKNAGYDSQYEKFANNMNYGFDSDYSSLSAFRLKYHQDTGDDDDGSGDFEQYESGTDYEISSIFQGEKPPLEHSEF